MKILLVEYTVRERERDQGRESETTGLRLEWNSMCACGVKSRKVGSWLVVVSLGSFEPERKQVVGKREKENERKARRRSLPCRFFSRHYSSKQPLTITQNACYLSLLTIGIIMVVVLYLVSGNTCFNCIFQFSSCHDGIKAQILEEN